MHRPKLLMVSVLLFVVAGACTRTQPPPKGLDTLVVTNFEAPVQVFPEGNGVAHLPSLQTVPNLYDPLIDYAFAEDDRGNFVPDFTRFEGLLAESWERSDDGLDWTFHLRQGVVSEYGNELTSEDVLWSFERAFAAEGFGAFMAQTGGVESLNQVTSIDDYTVRFTLQQPNPLFLHTRANLLIPIVDSDEAKKHATEEDPFAEKWLEQHAAGFGPYKIAEWIPNDHMTLEARDNYYREPPPISRIVLKQVPASSNRLATLLSGGSQVAESLTPRELEQVESRDGYKVVHVPGNLNLTILFNHTNPVLQDERVRQAIAYAIPYQQIIDDIYLGKAVVPMSLITPSYVGVDTSLWPYDTNVEKARELLNEAGAEQLDLTLLYIAGSPNLEAAGIILKSALAEVGVNLELEKSSPSIYEEQFAALESDLYLSDIENAFLPDAGYWTNLYVAGPPLLGTGYENARVEKLWEASNETDVESERQPLLEEIQQIVTDELPDLQMVLTGKPYGMRQDLMGYRWYADNVLRFYYISVSG